MQSLIKLSAMLTRCSVRKKHFVVDGVIKAVSVKFHPSRSDELPNFLGLIEVQLNSLATGDVVIPFFHMGRNEPRWRKSQTVTFEASVVLFAHIIMLL